MKTLALELRDRVREHPDAIAVIDLHGTHRLADVMAAAESGAEHMAQHDPTPPTVLIQADNTWQTVATALSVGLRGGVVAVLSPHATASEFVLAVEDVDPDMVVADLRTLEQWGVSDQDFPSGDAAVGDRHLRARRGDPRGVSRWNGGSVIAMTSGSTGRPKCVVQSEDALRYACSCTRDAVGLRPGDAVGAFVPLSSVAAACFGMYLPLFVGGPMVSIGKWSPAAALDAMAAHDVRWTMLVPTMALQLSLVENGAGRLAGMRAMTVGGGPMNASALERAEQFLGTTFLRVFGMSECLGHTTATPDDDPRLRLGTDGRPFPGTIVRAVNGAGEDVGTGEIGDAQVRGPSMFVGYARGGQVAAPTLTDDGYLPTGDLVEVATHGTITVMGRQKQIIIRGGRNIDINEVEAAVAGVPGIVQVCVVPIPDELLSERAGALVVTDGRALGLAEVTDGLSRRGVPRHNWPEYVFAVDDLPQNRVGKLSRPDAVRMAARLAGVPDPNSPRDE
ncbi:class I adenylate-forming enzyme family protein [Rhodococcus sp. SORGH_AS_0301]|uniref:class I adenylate-forming enzyme family protein n=1 Tax=Rhodococcus sp. SORGH_AS_0301 TaxID=3041780 RepID=UPI002783FD71|nr:class I adenylate-forming enzyme family protein [Rhodococcus sp. SORGH_AS_0301]MDQ1181673.1 acyl-CoA synthetase (AMP-forming)/AMP-acid ligase II [Rhodococcus sp. SORGH_AS_0301]